MVSPTGAYLAQLQVSLVGGIQTLVSIRAPTLESWRVGRLGRPVTANNSGGIAAQSVLLPGQQYLYTDQKRAHRELLEVLAALEESQSPRSKVHATATKPPEVGLGHGIWTFKPAANGIQARLRWADAADDVVASPHLRNVEEAEATPRARMAQDVRRKHYDFSRTVE